ALRHARQQVIAAEAQHQRPDLAHLPELLLRRVVVVVEARHRALPRQRPRVPEPLVVQELDHLALRRAVDLQGLLQRAVRLAQPDLVDEGHVTAPRSGRAAGAATAAAGRATDGGTSQATAGPSPDARRAGAGSPPAAVRP